MARGGETCKGALLLALSVWNQLSGAGERVEPVTSASEEAGYSYSPSAEAEGAPSLRITTDFMYPASGFGSYAPSGEVESHAVKVGPFMVRGAVHTGAGYNNNVALSDSNKVSSMLLTLTPSLAIGLEGATQRYHAIYRGNYGRYPSSARDDYDHHELALTAAHAWTTRFRTTANYDYVRAHTPRGVVATAVSSVQPWTLQSVRASAAYGAAGAVGGLEGDLAYSRRRYTGASNVKAIGDFDQFTVGGTFSYRVAPKTRLIAQVHWSDFTHPDDPTLDNTEVQYMLGVSWEATAKTTGRLRAGHTAKDFSNASRADFAGRSYDAGITWAPRTYSIVDFSASRALSESYETGSSFVVNSVADLGWRHIWPQGIRSKVNYVYGRIQQEGLNRTDTYQNWGGRLSYGVKQSLRAGVEVRRDIRDSDAPELNYKRNIMMLTLETAL